MRHSIKQVLTHLMAGTVSDCYIFPTRVESDNTLVRTKEHSLT